MEQVNYQGNRYIGLLRCSVPQQADTSLDDQRRVLEAYAREHGFVCVDYKALGGVSGSLPGNRDDIHQLIDRKKQKDDFDLLLVQDTSRFTRSGITHQHYIEAELNAAGIEVVFVTSPIPSGPEGDLVKSVLAFSDQQHARSISFSSTRGSMSSILDNRSAYCRRPPYAIDRLYIAPDGQEVCILRNLPDGTQVQLDPRTQQPTATYGANERTGIPNHRIKQKQERVVLVPGDEKCVEVVQRIFRRHYIEGWGRFRIAQELNVEGVPSPNGKKWNTEVIGRILQNPIYLGRGIANRRTQAIYHMRSPECPAKANVSKKDLYSRRRPPLRIRPRAEWHVQEHPRLLEFLNPEVRQIAAARQLKHLERQAASRHPQPNRDRHFNSSFFLKGMLRSKQGDLPMTGVVTGKKGCKKRYYRVSRAYSSPDGNPILRRLVRAEPVEQIVLETVKNSLLSMPNLRDEIERGLRAVLKEASGGNEQRETFLADREAIRKKVKALVTRLNAEMMELVEDEIARLEAELHALNDRIAHCQASKPMDEATIGRTVEQTVVAIRDLAQTLSDAPPATLCQYLQLFIQKLVVDLETNELLVEIGVPIDLNADSFKVCLVEGSACKPCNQTHQAPTAHLGTYSCLLPLARRRSPDRVSLPMSEAA